jgi:hypothetical protein
MAKKKAKPSKNPADILSRKKDKLDWENFNFLENLLVFCLQDERNAPRESEGGVHFRINPKPDRECLCLMFHIDRQKDPLITAQGIKRPDYMVLFVENDSWICTIVEMKGGTERGFRHGVEQIKVMRDRLREELKLNAAKIKIKFQAIILISINSQIPRKLIEKEEQQGLVILPLQYEHKADLFNYVSKVNRLDERYIHEETRFPRVDSMIETVLMNCALQERIIDNFAASNKAKTSNSEGIYMNYNLPNKDDYAALTIDNTAMKIGVKESNETFTDKIIDELLKLGLKSNHHYKIQKIN